MNCPNCGWDNPPENRFCQHCGAPLPDPAAPNPGPAPSPMPQRSPAGRVISALLRVALYVFLFFGCQSCVMSGYMTAEMMGDLSYTGLALSDEWMQSILDGVMEQLVVIMLISNLLFILLVCLLFRLRRKDPAAEMGVRPFAWKRIPLYAVFGTAMNLFTSVTLNLLPLPDALYEELDSLYASAYDSPAGLLVEILSMAIVTGMAEELLFRGIAMTRFDPAMGRAASVIVSALIFGFAHGTPIAIGYASALGLVLALLYEKTGSVLPGIFCHIFFNLTAYWIPAENNMLLTVLYVLSIVTIPLCAVLIWRRKESSGTDGTPQK